MSQKIESNITEVLGDGEETRQIIVDEQFLKNMKGIMEVVNDRINWKIGELLPIGLFLKQIDDLLENKSAKV